MAKFEVTIDGEKFEVEAPETATEEEVYGYAKQAKSPPTLGERALGGAKAVGSGLAGGALAIPGAVGDVQEMLTEGAGFREGAIRFPRTADIKDYFGVAYKPKSETEKSLQDMMEPLGEMLAMPARSLGLKARGIIGGAMGAGSATAQRVAPDMPFAGPLGALVGAVAGSPGIWHVPQAFKTIGDWVKEQGPTKIQQAAGRAKAGGESLGTPVALFQGFDQPTPFLGVAEELMRTPQGEPLRRTLSAQLPAAQERVRSFVEQVMPGAQRTSRKENWLAREGTKAFNQPGRSLTTMERGPMADVFPASMRESLKGDWQVFDKVFEKAPADVAKIGYYLRAQNPDAFPTMFKGWLDKQVESALTTSGGMPTQFLNIGDAVVGAAGSQKREVFREAVRQTAKSYGKDSVAAVQVAEDLFDAVQMAARGRSGLGRIDSGEMRREAGSGVAAMGRAINLIAPFRGVSEVVERMFWKNTYARLAEALATPEGLDKLIQLSKFSAADRRTQGTIMQLLGINAASE